MGVLPNLSRSCSKRSQHSTLRPEQHEITLSQLLFSNTMSPSVFENFSKVDSRPIGSINEEYRSCVFEMFKKVRIHLHNYKRYIYINIYIRGRKKEKITPSNNSSNNKGGDVCAHMPTISTTFGCRTCKERYVS